MVKIKGKTVEMRNIAGRDIGDETLECSGCGRFYGKDSIMSLEHVNPLDGSVGKCPECEGFIYPKSKLPKKEEK